MIKELQVSIHPDYIADDQYLRKTVAHKLKVDINDITALKIIKRSIDARKLPVYRLRVLVYLNEKPSTDDIRIEYKPVNSEKSVIIVGSGPAGLFAALRLIELGIKPVIFERGHDVQKRRRDLKQINQEGFVNPDSNYCFGEGGAGTYSDGKLYTRSTKRGDTKRILQILVRHGASPDIKIDARPHIGSNKLPNIIKAIRETILKNNGEVHFESKVTDIIIVNGKTKGVVVNNQTEYFADAVILTTGHSARDIFYLLNNKNILLEAKPFALGVRVEHPQQLIDRIQYHTQKRHQNLPAAYYNLSCQIKNRGVYSFCMCPGGMIVPASTNNEEIVVNGMSLSRRNSPFSNSGLVVSVTEEEWAEYNEYGVFAGLEFQKMIERKAFLYGGGKQVAPAQRITDFVEGKLSNDLPPTSYIPGTKSALVNEIFPVEIYKRLKQSLFVFNKKMKGFYTEIGQVLATESRTSSPVRVLRDKETLMSVSVEGLFPGGEGAGYAGGIVSAAIDGEKCAEASVKYIG